jgi:MoaA/NifB/PqqE/SkfB family radical SAM enzyme
MLSYPLENINNQLSFFNTIKEDYLYNFSLTMNKPLIGPSMLQLILTTKCNLKCKMCGVWRADEEEAETPYIKKAIDDAYRLGNLQQVYFTGGEVLMRDDIFSLVKYMKDYYPQLVVYLNTNGLLLNKKNIDKLFDLELTDLGISIDSPNPNIHNSLRGEGVFERVIEALDYINAEKKRRNVKYPLLGTLSVLMDQTLDTIYDMLDFCVKHNFSGISIQPYVCNSDLRGQKRDEFWIKEDRIPLLRDTLNRIENKKGKIPLYINIECDKIYNYFTQPLYVDKCYAGFTRVLVVGKKINFVCNGPNDEKYQHFGMVDKDSINEAWSSEKAGFFRNTIKSCKNNCVQFCSIRPSSDSLVDIHQRLLDKHNLFLLFREIELLEDYIVRYPALKIKEIIDSDYLIIIKNLYKLLNPINDLVLNYKAEDQKRYLLKDLASLGLHLKSTDSAGLSLFNRLKAQIALGFLYLTVAINKIDDEGANIVERIYSYNRIFEQFMDLKRRNL